MKTSDFDFELPKDLIAQFPPEERGTSRLMVLDRKTAKREHRMVSELPLLLEKGTVLVFNNSRVRKARLTACAVPVHGAGSNAAEFLLVKQIDELSWEVLAKRSKRRKAGSRYCFEDGTFAELAPAENGKPVLRFDSPIDDGWLDRFGHIPLPPYIKRKDSSEDAERYQCVYAAQTGSSAAPTAGLHFTGELLSGLKAAGMETVFITLHVGLGTFLPVRSENIEDHVMHEEVYTIGESEAAVIEKAKREGRKILAVGTTSLRALESAWIPSGDASGAASGEAQFRRGEGATSIFLYPGCTFNAADMLFTNFHTPRSTLLMLVSAFAKRELILESYREAIEEGYRFFSYGDAMLIR